MITRRRRQCDDACAKDLVRQRVATECKRILLIGRMLAAHLGQEQRFVSRSFEEGPRGPCIVRSMWSAGT